MCMLLLLLVLVLQDQHQWVMFVRICYFMFA
jgi:hypothetical protein